MRHCSLLRRANAKAPYGRSSALIARRSSIARYPSAPFAGRTNGLHHRLLSANALQHRIGTDAIGQLLDAGHALVTALGHDVGRAELAGEFLPRLVTAHRDDPLRTHQLCGKHTEKADRTV